jgi:hypothetical protein
MAGLKVGKDDRITGRHDVRLAKMTWWQDARITGCQDGRMAG